MGRLKVLKPRVDVAPVSRLAEFGAQVGHEREHTGSSWRAIRRGILARDCRMCTRCREEGRFEVGAEIDHRVPAWKGGGDEDDNLQTLCGPCHKAKSAREATERATT